MYSWWKGPGGRCVTLPLSLSSPCDTYTSSSLHSCRQTSFFNVLAGRGKQRKEIKKRKTANGENLQLKNKKTERDKKGKTGGKIREDGGRMVVFIQTLSSGAVGTEYPPGSTICTVGDVPSHSSTTCTDLVTQNSSI